MCGIVGIIDKNASDLVTVMTSSIHHRGPDSSGVFTDPSMNLALGMTRLAILDIEGGYQPIHSPDGRYVLVFNGEIYNSPELRASLIESGTQFVSSNSDTEVLLYLLIRYGKECLPMLNGMFAFIFYDSHCKTILSARDRFGIKPLYYASSGDRLAIASELKSLKSVPWISREISSSSLSHFVSLHYIPGVQTIFSGVQRLPSSHLLEYSCESLNISQWSRLAHNHSFRGSRLDALDALQTTLQSAVSRWSLSDVPIGCSLSGGLDSSSIVASMARLGLAPKTYSVGFESDNLDSLQELKLARELSCMYGTDHTELVVNPADLLSSLLSMVWSLDEPYAGGLPSWYVYKLMSTEVKVCHTGTGGDELFGNYGKWKTLEGGVFRRFLLRSRFDKAGFERRFFNCHYYTQHLEKISRIFVDSSFVPNTSDYLFEYMSSLSESSSLRARDFVMSLDMSTQLPEEFLMMTDRFSMHHSIEARTPFLDNDLVDLVLSFSPGLRTSRSSFKGLLRDAMAPLLPTSFLTAPKRGFTLPISDWLRGPLKSALTLAFEPSRIKSQGLFNPDIYSSYIQPHLEGRFDYSGTIWPLFMFQLWYSLSQEADPDLQRPVTDLF